MIPAPHQQLPCLEDTALLFARYQPHISGCRVWKTLLSYSHDTSPPTAVIAVQGHSGPRPLLPRAGCAGKSEKRPGKSPQAVSNCSNLCDSACSLKCIYLRKSSLSSSLSQYSAARPASERYRATAHVGYSCPALASASNDQAAKAAMSVLERVGKLFRESQAGYSA